MQDELIFRTIRAEERDELLALFRHLNANDAHPPGQPMLDDIWAQLLTNPALYVFVAELDDRLVSIRKMHD